MTNLPSPTPLPGTRPAELLRLREKYGVDAFHDLQSALKSGEITSAVELATMIVSAGKNRIVKKPVEKPRQQKSKRNRDQLLDSIEKLKMSSDNREQLVGNLASKIADSEILNSMKTLRVFSRSIGVDAEGNLDRWRLTSRIIRALLERDAAFIEKKVNDARFYETNEASLSDWVRIIVKA